METRPEPTGVRHPEDRRRHRQADGDRPPRRPGGPGEDDRTNREHPAEDREDLERRRSPEDRQRQPSGQHGAKDAAQNVREEQRAHTAADTMRVSMDDALKKREGAAHQERWQHDEEQRQQDVQAQEVGRHPGRRGRSRQNRSSARARRA